MFYNTAVIITPLPFLEEYGIKDGENCYILNFDCSNVNDIAKKITKVPKFKMKLPEDIYRKLLAPGESTYKEKQNSRWLVEATNQYFLTNTSDNELCQIHNKDRYVPEPGYRWETSYERKEILYRQGFIKVIKEIKEIKEEKECTTD